ncbi:MAG TPA: hypothetical protein DIT05_19775 [Morganella sp. (in: Bacteria)]|nr:hypothetical protein [Morganella sp. (in: enterobacteria)]
MNIGQILKINNFSDLSTEKLSNIAIYSGEASENIIEGIGAIGTLMFESSCNDNDNLNKDIIGKLGLLIQASALIAEVLNENTILAQHEVRKRPAPPCAIKRQMSGKTKLIALLAILIMLSCHYSNLKVTCMKMNQRKK